MTESGIEYEADPRHVDLISESLGITAANSVCSPGVKNPDPSQEAEKENECTSSPKMCADTIESIGGTRLQAAQRQQGV